MKSCLKHSPSAPHVLHQPTPPASPTSPSVDPDIQTKDEKRKSVTFPEDDEVEVFYVEDWDRSPAAVVERLTYKYVRNFFLSKPHGNGY